VGQKLAFKPYIRSYKIKSINLLDINSELPYILNRSLLACTAIRLVVRAHFFPAGFPAGFLPPDFRLGSLFALEGFLHVAACFFECALGIVVGLDGLPVFIDGAFALPGYIENLA